MLGGFVNAIFLICIAVAIVLEGVERLWEPPEINSENLLLVRGPVYADRLRSFVFGGAGYNSIGVDSTRWPSCRLQLCVFVLLVRTTFSSLSPVPPPSPVCCRLL